MMMAPMADMMATEMMASAAMMDDAEVLEGDLAERESMQRKKLFQPPDETKEYGERRYWQVKPGSNTSRLVTENKFWVECARSMAQGQPSEALSAYWMLACEESINAALLALAMLQVPLTNVGSREHSEQGLVLRAQGSAVVYAKQIRWVVGWK